MRNGGKETEGFIVDEMLGKLTRWLRILGFYVIWAGELRGSYDEDIDNKIITRALKDDLIIITRDKELLRKAKRYDIKVIYVKNSSLIDKIKSVLDAINYDIELISNVNPARCPVCNGLLIKVDKDEIYDKIPPRTREIYDEFWLCRKCGKIYWKGSHWKNISKTIKKLLKNKSSKHNA